MFLYPNIFFPFQNFFFPSFLFNPPMGQRNNWPWWWLQWDKVCWRYGWMWVHSKAVWSLLWLSCLLKNKYIWFNKFGNVNFLQHPDRGKSGRVRSIWRSIIGANSGLSQHNQGPKVFRNAPRFYLGVRVKRKHVPSLTSAFENHNIATTKLRTINCYGKKRGRSEGKREIEFERQLKGGWDLRLALH